MKQRSAKRIQTISLSYSTVKSTLIVLLTSIKFEKIKHENFDFVHFLSSFSAHNSKIIQYMQILKIPNDCSANRDYSYLFGASYELYARLVSYGLKTVCPRHFTFLLEHFCNFSHNNCVGVAHIVRPHLDY